MEKTGVGERPLFFFLPLSVKNNNERFIAHGTLTYNDGVFARGICDRK
jgi:hypothetical protein